jgi:hypothetical protein
MTTLTKVCTSMNPLVLLWKLAPPTMVKIGSAVALFAVVDFDLNAGSIAAFTALGGAAIGGITKVWRQSVAQAALLQTQAARIEALEQTVKEQNRLIADMRAQAGRDPSTRTRLKDVDDQ